ncbi:MAG: chloride channel protein [Deltaproteobacteria bacterium]|jgi:CIC family chloride channel protein|nr:chloride channel protein [Deltaproteobacteria bacterium]
MKFLDSIGKEFDRLKRKEIPKWIFFGSIIGVVSAFGAILFFYGLSWTKFFLFDVLAGVPIPEAAGERLVTLHVDSDPRLWLLFLLPALGGLVSGFIVYTFAPEAEGHGIDAMLDAFHNKGGQIRGRVPFVKSIASIVTLASGGSAGREGPIAQIGAGFGSWIGRVFHLSPKERRILLLAGTAGGLGAIFRAPLGAAITSIEVLYKEDFETEAIIPCIISSVMAYIIFTHVFGHQPIFETPPFEFTNAIELFFYMILGLICAPLGLLYIRMFYGCRDQIFKKIRIKRHFVPAIGGLGVGLLGLIAPQILSGGYGVIQDAIFGELGIGIMAMLVLMKMAATSLTIGSGGSGGVFGPSLFIGGMIGGVVGHVAQLIAPEAISEPGAFVLVGMASFFAGVANAPIGALLMVSEMTGGYSLLPQLMLISGLALLFSRKWSIYEKQVKNKFASPAHLSDATINIMKGMQVKKIFNPDTYIIPLPEDLRLKELTNVVAHSKESFFPVVNDDFKLVGVLSLRVVRKYLFGDSSLGELLVVGEIAGKPITVKLEDDLFAALSKFLSSGYWELPVVDSQNGEMLGVLNLTDVFSAYHSEISRLKEKE